MFGEIELAVMVGNTNFLFENIEKAFRHFTSSTEDYSILLNTILVDMTVWFVAKDDNIALTRVYMTGNVNHLRVLLNNGATPSQELLSYHESFNMGPVSKLLSKYIMFEEQYRYILKDISLIPFDDVNLSEKLQTFGEALTYIESNYDIVSSLRTNTQHYFDILTNKLKEAQSIGSLESAVASMEIC